MDRSSASANPFLTLQSRYWVLGTYLLVSTAVGLLYGLLKNLHRLPQQLDDPISTPILSITVLTVLAGVILAVGRDRGLSVNYLFGRQSRAVDQAVNQAANRGRISLFYAGLLVASLLIFSLGSFSVVFYFLSLGFPDYAARILETNQMLGGGDSRYPQLYDQLMLLVLLVLAPFAEELVFRGILLQRWAMKWGLRWGVVASSVLFGLLHINNPVGLTLFGLVMGLLYVQTRSLWVPIACHGLNNLAAVGIDWLSRQASGEQTYTLADMQASWWVGLILIGVSAPFLMRFVWRSWPQRQAKIPYLVNFELADVNPH
jgi:uncharacterized protein